MEKICQFGWICEGTGGGGGVCRGGGKGGQSRLYLVLPTPPFLSSACNEHGSACGQEAVISHLNDRVSLWAGASPSFNPQSLIRVSRPQAQPGRVRSH